MLQSWNDGVVKSEILDFVARVTKSGGADFVPPSERIAVFDNDGTLWCEQPLQVQWFFLIDRARELAASDPRLSSRLPFKALLAGDLDTLQAIGKQALVELLFATHAGVSVEEFRDSVRNWMSNAYHPKFDRPFKVCTYQPQLELLHYLRHHGFKTFLVSLGGIDFMRSFSEELYGIPREQVIGSSMRTRFECEESRVYLLKTAELNTFNDYEIKPQNIGLHIGRRPILAFGNSDGDLAMLRYTRGGNTASLALLLHHDDEVREVEYDRDFRLSPLAEALDKADQYGISVVSMKRDWKRVFSGPSSQERLERARAPRRSKKRGQASEFGIGH